MRQQHRRVLGGLPHMRLDARLALVKMRQRVPVFVRDRGRQRREQRRRSQQTVHRVGGLVEVLTQEMTGNAGTQAGETIENRTTIPDHRMRLARCPGGIGQRRRGGQPLRRENHQSAAWLR